MMGGGGKLIKTKLFPKNKNKEEKIERYFWSRKYFKNSSDVVAKMEIM